MADAMVIDDGPVGTASVAPPQGAGPSEGGQGQQAVPQASRPVKVFKTSENETEEERRRRHQEKKRKVEEHRAEILRRVKSETARQKLHKQDTNFSCVVAFDNTLPPPPVDARMMNYPFDDDFMFSYDMIQGVSSEQGFLHQLHAEPGLGVPIDLVDPKRMFTLPPNQRPPMNPVDAKITSEEYARPVAARNKEAVITAEPLVDWMMRSTHMHLDLYDSVYKHADPQKLEEMRRLQRKKDALAKVGTGTRKQRIEASFKAVAGDQPLVHPTNKALQPRRVWDVLPATHLWALNHVLVAFDADPDPVAPGLGVASASATSSSSSSAGASSAAAAKRARLEGAVIRTMQAAAAKANVQDSSVRVQYLQPSSDSSSEELLKGVRNYHMVVEKADISRGDEQYVLLWDDARMSVYMAPIRSRAALTKIANDEDSASAAASAMQNVKVRSRAHLPEEVDAGIEASSTFVDSITAEVWREEVQKNREQRRKEQLEARRQAQQLAQEQREAAAAASAAFLANGKRARSNDSSDDDDEEDSSSSSEDETKAAPKEVTQRAPAEASSSSSSSSSSSGAPAAPAAPAARQDDDAGFDKETDEL